MSKDNKSNFGREYFMESVDESTLKDNSSDVRVKVDQLEELKKLGLLIDDKKSAHSSTG
tara:strand:+ start:332 stop:508 length:177 start_codon:yes stop_codon:yes gene_type:complete